MAILRFGLVCRLSRRNSEGRLAGSIVFVAGRCESHGWAEAVPEGEGGGGADEAEGDELPDCCTVFEQVAGVADAVDPAESEIDAVGEEAEACEESQGFFGAASLQCTAYYEPKQQRE